MWLHKDALKVRPYEVRPLRKDGVRPVQVRPYGGRRWLVIDGKADRQDMDIAKIKEAFAAYSEDADAADAARYGFFEGLLTLQQQRAEELEKLAPYEPLDAEECEKLYWSSDSHVFAGKGVAIDADAFFETLTRIASYIAENAGLNEKVSTELEGYDWKALCERTDLSLAGSDPAKYLESLSRDADALGVSTALPVSIFSLAPLFSLRPHLQQAAAKAFALVDVEKGRRMHDNPLTCPLCGSKAVASFVGTAAGTDGKGRKQYCGTCGTSWPFERIRCGTCGSFSGEKLHYFHIEGDPGHRLQSCDECGQYHRVAFQDELGGEPVMEVEDVVMAKLDKIALDPRFRREG